MTATVQSPRSPLKDRGNLLVMAGHVLVAAFVALARYPATQDGPAHVYTVHVLRELARDPASPYHRYFVPNLHFGSYGLFFYFGVWAGDFWPLERVASVTFFAALVLLPASAFAFWRALESSMPAESPLPRPSAWALACPLAYSYFLYRGLFNYALGVPLAFFALAAVVAQGAAMRAPARIALALAALLATALAAFAHASAIAFLFFAIPAACIAGRAPGAKARRLVGAATWLLLLASTRTSHLGDDPTPPEWWTPWKSAAMLVRAFGVTHSWLEVVSALTVLVVLGATVARLWPSLRKLRTRYAELWPVALGLVVLGGYFVVPNSMYGISGLNERLPLLAGMLLIPFVPGTGKAARALALAAVPFGAYVAVINELHEGKVRAMRDAADAVPMERGSIVYLAALDLKLGTVSADLGRYLGADVARRHDAVTGNVFTGNVVFPILSTPETPTMADATPVQSFSHMSEPERALALADPKSPISLFFDDTVARARGARYLVVVPEPSLDAAFHERVLTALDARPAKGFSQTLPIYELPQPSGVATSGDVDKRLDP